MIQDNKKPSQEIARASSPAGDAWRRLRKNRLAVGGGAFLIFLILLSLLTPWLTRGFVRDAAFPAYDQQNLDLGATPPSGEHWLGTDDFGRDVLARILYGGRVSLTVALVATAVSVLIGVLYGSVAGYAGGKTDLAMMRFVDILYTLPFPIFVVVLMVFFERSLLLLFIAIGAVEWLTMARIVRGEIISLKEREFVEAARAMGLSRGRILFAHLIPNALGPIVVYATLTVPNVILLEAFVSYLGLGVQAPMPSWGTLILEGAELMEENPWLLAFPGMFLTGTLLSLNFLGDGLRDALDPRVSKD